MGLDNARDAKAVPGGKTDVDDAQWLHRLHQYGLLRGSFRPSRDIFALRASKSGPQRIARGAFTRLGLTAINYTFDLTSQRVDDNRTNLTFNVSGTNASLALGLTGALLSIAQSHANPV